MSVRVMQYQLDTANWQDQLKAMQEVMQPKKPRRTKRAMKAEVCGPMTVEAYMAFIEQQKACMPKKAEMPLVLKPSKPVARKWVSYKIPKVSCSTGRCSSCNRGRARKAKRR